MAQVDYFLKLDGAEGESPDEKHKGEISLLQFSWGVQNLGSSDRGGGAGSGKAQFSDFQFVKEFDKASPILEQFCASGEHIPTGVLTCRKAGKEQQEYLKITFTDCFVSSYQISAGGGSVIPHDSISINFSKFETEYKPQTEKGTLGAGVKKGWDLKKNKVV